MCIWARVMLELHSVDAFYGDGQVLHGVTLSVPPGGSVALVGRNGTGKTTLLKSIMGAGPRVSGDITLDGTAIDRLAPFRRARLGLCLVPEDRRIYPQLSVRENLDMARHACAGRKPREAAEVLAMFPMLHGLESRRGFELSGGQQQMLAIARAAVARPRLFLLDEPTEGLAPIIVDALVDQIRNLRDDDSSALLLAEQNLAFARHCTSLVYLIDSGRIVFSGTWQEFDLRPDLITRHLAI
jgi:ABC-type branched-subunit amino acid transport system ATPase component